MILALVMLTSAIPLAASGGGSTLTKDPDGYYLINTYDEFHDDLLIRQGQSDYVRYRLNADIFQIDNENSRDLYVNYFTLELDLNGHTLSRTTSGRDPALFSVYNDAYMTVWDSSFAKTGKLEYNNTYTSRAHVINCTKSTVIIESGNLEIKSKGDVILCEGGTLMIYGGNFEATGSGAMGLRVRRTLDGSPAPIVMIYDAVFRTEGKTIDVYKNPQHKYGDAQYPFVGVLGGEFYTDAETGFSYVANGDGNVVVYGGLIAHKSLNPQYDNEIARGAEKKIVTIGETEYERVSPPNWLVTDEQSVRTRLEDAVNRFILSKIPTNSNYYKEFGEYIASILAQPCEIVVGERKTSPVVLKLYNKHSDVEKVTLCSADWLASNWDMSPWQTVAEIGNPSDDVSFTVDRPTEETVRYYRLRVKFTDKTTWDDYIALRFEEAKFTLSGTPYPSMNNVRYGNTLFCAINDYPENIPVDSLKFEWLVDGKIIGTERTVKLSDPSWVGKLLTVRVRSTAADGAIVSSPVKIDKAYNNTTPDFPTLKVDVIGDYLTKVTLGSIQNDQEYLFSKKLSKDLTESDWNKAFKLDSDKYECSAATLSASYGVDVAKGDTLYVYTRFCETDTAHAGSTVVSSSALIDEVVWLKSITFPDAVNGYLYIPYTGGGETYDIKYDLNPSNANSGGNINWSSSLSILSPTSAETVSAASGCVTVKPTGIGGSNLRAYYMTYMENLYGQVNVVIYDPNNVTAGYLRVAEPIEDATVYEGTGYCAQIPEFIIEPTAEPEYKWYFTVGTMYGSEKKTDVGFATIDSATGEIVTTAPGKVEVSLYADGVMVDSYILTVIEKPENYVALEAMFASSSAMTLKVGEKRAIELLKSPANATADSFTFTSSAPNIASVATDGTVTAISAGEAVITVKAGGENVSTTVKITVTGGTMQSIISGDVNGDGKINNRDVIALMKAVIVETSGKGSYPKGFIRDAADLHADGKINNRDVVALMKLVIANA